MNSMSRPRDNDDCGCKRPIEDANVLLKCKTGCSVTVPTFYNGDVNVNDNSGNGYGTTLVSLTLNTKKFKDPCFKFDFAANIIGTDYATLRFQIYKQCKGDAYRTKFGPVWKLDYFYYLDQIVSFFVCDCDCDCDCDKDDCCTYSVVVTTAPLLAAAVTVNNPAPAPTPVTVNNPILPGFTFNNPTLSALVVEKNCSCK